jgi:hypothetical protein
VVLAFRDQTNQVLEMSIEHLMVDLQAGRQLSALDGRELALGFAVERELAPERRLRIVLQRPVGGMEDVAVAVGAEVGRGDRIEEQVADEIPIAQRREAIDDDAVRRRARDCLRQAPSRDRVRRFQLPALALQVRSAPKVDS